MPVNVLFVVAEMAPLAKVGGVGDVGGSLAAALRQQGLDVRVALPLYGSIDRSALDLGRVATPGDGATIWRTAVGEVPVYLVEHEAYFGRERVYGYDDDLDRFLAFADGLLAGADALGWRPDVVHLNDWNTGFVATRLFEDEHPWARAARVCTIHNLAYASPFPETWAKDHGISSAALRSPDGLPAVLPYSALAQGLLHADAISTVSPTYAREILTPDAGGEMAPFLRTFGDRLWGILNGIDMQAADPATDRQLAANFDAERLDERAANKRAVQRELGLPEDDVPLVGMIARLVRQKGADLAAAAIERLLAGGERFQIAVLGEGEEQYERELSALAARHPAHVGVRIAFDLKMSQLIYGGSDLFLMPSRYEPCGLGQMFAMRYGSVPVVHRTGGLADSVHQYDAATDTGTGFLFGEPSADALAATLREALSAYRDGEAWRRLQRRGMAEDFSWSRSAGEYVRLYDRSIELARSARGR